MEFNTGEIIALLFATIGPLKVTIVCASLTAHASPGFLKQVSFRSVLVASVVCILFAVLGEAILKLFKVSIPAFQIGGGIIVLLFSIEMVVGGKKGDRDEGPSTPAQPPLDPSLDLAVYPLAIPMMASVSGLVAIVSLIAQSDDLRSLLLLIGIIAAIMALNYLCLRSCQYLVRALGSTTLLVVGKIMGVILTALAIELVLMGLAGLGLLDRIREVSPSP